MNILWLTEIGFKTLAGTWDGENATYLKAKSQIQRERETSWLTRPLAHMN